MFMEPNIMIELIKGIHNAVEKETEISDLLINLSQELTAKSEAGWDIDIDVIKKVEEFAGTSNKFSKELVEYAGKLIDSLSSVTSI